MNDTETPPNGQEIEKTDPMAEIEALKAVSGALSNLDKHACERVLRWACDRFGISTKEISSPPNPRGGSGAGGSSVGRNGNLAEFEDLATLFAAASPKTEPEKALIAAVWKQHSEQLADWGSQEINTELKHLGHGVSNITDALTSLMRRKPSLVIQTRKEGSSKQARKKYKVTVEGLSKVQRMLAGNDEE